MYLEFNFPNMKVFFLLEHLPPVHEWEYVLSPLHFAPPFTGEGLLQALDLV